MSPQKKENKESLLNKYRIPVQHLDFDYVEKCNNANELEKILKILQSGEEGYYPELIMATEKRLEILNPKCKLLRKANPIITTNSLNNDEKQLLKNDFINWINDIEHNDKKLKTFAKDDKNLPEVREIKQVEDEENKNNNKSNNNKRISATDYASWDKYDPDTEILKINLQEEKLKETVKHNKIKEINNVEINEINDEIEANRIGTFERCKGNEFYKSGDFKQALYHYTMSIKIKPTIENLNNRALVYFKLKNYEKALNDCNSVLDINKFNKKALIRKAQTLEHLNRFNETNEIIEKLIRIDPNDTLIQQLALKLSKQCKIKTKKSTRLTITEIENEIKRPPIIIPIPGISKNNTGPHFVKCQEENIEKFEINLKNHLNNNVIRVVPIDEDDDCCIIHGKDTKEIKKNQKEIKPQERGDFNDNFNVENLHSPYTFLKQWGSACSSNNLMECFEILNKIDPKKINEVIGCKLDNDMFTKILECLSEYFTNKEYSQKLLELIENIIQLPRFDIIAMLLSEKDRKLINKIIEFLRMQNIFMSEDIINKFK